MCRSAREAEATSCVIECIERPNSNFALIDRHFSSFPSIGPIRRIFSQVRSHDAKTAIIEELGPNGAIDLAQENEDLQTRFGASPTSRVRRLSFFTQPCTTKDDVASLKDEHFTGYAIIKEDHVPGKYTKARIYESVVRRSRRENNFVRGAQEWRCRVGSQVFLVRGYLYAQQNAATNSCAHVACRTAAARFHPDGDMSYREMNSLLGIDHVQVHADQGLTSTQMIAILEAAGARCIAASYPPSDPMIEAPPFHRLIYGTIESGFPAILCFAAGEDRAHAIPVFGHTFNEDMWVAHAELSYFRIGGTTYIPSDSWLSTYVGHDDNWGSNYCIPRHFLFSRQLCKHSPVGPQPCVMQSHGVEYVIATLPRDAKVGPMDAEAMGVRFLEGMLPQLPEPSEPWKKRLTHYAKSNLLVVRPILIQSSEYLEHLGKVVGWDYSRIRSSIIQTLREWPEFPKGWVWMVELSVPELFSANRRKVGEVLIRVDQAPGCDIGNYVLARVPGYFAFPVGGRADAPEYRFFDNGAQGHVALFGCEDADPRPTTGGS